MSRAYPSRVQLVKLKPFPKCNSISGHVKKFQCDCCKEEAVLKIVFNRIGKTGPVASGETKKSNKGKSKVIYLCEEHKESLREYIQYF